MLTQVVAIIVIDAVWGIRIVVVMVVRVIIVDAQVPGVKDDQGQSTQQGANGHGDESGTEEKFVI